MHYPLYLPRKSHEILALEEALSLNPKPPQGSRYIQTPIHANIDTYVLATCVRVTEANEVGFRILPHLPNAQAACFLQASACCMYVGDMCGVERL